MSENTSSQPYISYMANKRLQGEEQYHSKEMYRSHADVRLKSASQKLNFAIAKAIKKL